MLTWLVWAAAAGCAVGAATGWTVGRALHVPQLDQLGAYRPPTAAVVRAANGMQVASFATQRRIELGPEQIPDRLKLALVAAEDARFYRHGGVDPLAILRAAVGSVRAGRLGGAGGGSTITQQLALNLFLSRDPTLARKAREALLAMDMEKRLSKAQILTMYTNQVYFGHGAWGVEAAARLYFGRPASELTLAQSALLAGMIPSPENRFSPTSNPEGALARRNRVLERMRGLGFADASSCDAALAEPLGVALHRARPGLGDYFVEELRRQVVTAYGQDALYRDGLQVDITMDPALQRAADTAVRESLVALEKSQGFRRPVNVVKKRLSPTAADYQDPSWARLDLHRGAMVRAVAVEVTPGEARLRVGRLAAHLAADGARWTGAASLDDILRPGDLVLVRLADERPDGLKRPLEVTLLQEPAVEAALIAMDNRSGAILAMVGGFDFERSEFNRATQAARQCGSTFKPFVYLTAFERGFTPADTVLDAPFLLPDGRGRLTYCPRNYHPQYYGITTLRRAMEESFNASAVKVQELVGRDAVIDTARRFGIGTELLPYPSLALGSMEVRLLDLVRAYAGIANLGEVPEPYLVSAVRDRDGRVLEQHEIRRERVMAAPPAYLMLHVMRGVVLRGTAVAARSLPGDLAGKTGTTDDLTDAWFVGFSPRITVGVWVGRDLSTPIGPRMTGAVAALPIWQRFMADYLESLSEGQRREQFPTPAGVVFAPVGRMTGRIAGPDEDDTVDEAFLDGTEPLEGPSDELRALVALPWPYQLPWYTPQPGEPMPTPEAVAIADARLRSGL